MSVYYKIARAISRLFVRLFFPFKIMGGENIPKDGGLVICCNHISLLDPVFLVLTTKRQICFMAKEELFKNKLLGWLYKKFGAFPIKRGKGDQDAMNTAAELVKSGKLLGIFIEGTRTKNEDASPMRPKSGAAVIAHETGADVLPAAIIYQKGRPRIFRRATLRFGRMIKSNEIVLESHNRTELKRVTGIIMNEITDMWEEGI